MHTRTMTKLTPSQITALQFIAKEPWVAAWWGDKCQTRWPKELNARSVHSLVTLRFARLMHVARFDRALTITAEGMKALKLLEGNQSKGENTLAAWAKIIVKD